MRLRYRKNTENTICYLSRESRRSIVFVHGLGGDNSEQYWGKIGSLLDSDPQFSDANIYFWKYPTTFAPKPSFLSPLRGYSLPNIESLDRSLGSFIEDLLAGKAQPLTLVGHSLGGLLVLGVVKELAHKGKLESLKKVAVIGSPFKAPLLALIHSLFTLSSNAQIYGLTRTRELEARLVDGLGICRSRNVQSVFIESNKDATVKYNKLSEFFDVRRTITGPHTWMRQITGRNHDGFSTLRNALLLQLEPGE